MQSTFQVTVDVRVGTRPGQASQVIEFDADDIYDHNLAAEVRAIARRAQFLAGLRESEELAE